MSLPRLRKPALPPVLSPPRASERREGLHRIIVAWAFGSIFFNTIMGAPLAAYVRTLGGSDFTWGIIAAAPMIGSVSQLFGSCAIEATRKRKGLFLTFGLIQRLLWLPIAALPWVFSKGHPLLLPALTTLVMISFLCGHFAGPAWMSWMADFVPLKVRGAFFANRMRVGTLMALLSVTFAGWLLDLRPALSTYTILFSVVSLCGVVDVLVFRWVPEPEMASEGERLTLGQRIRSPFGDPIFRQFLLYATGYAFSVNFMAAPLWLFAMESLHMSKLGANLTLMGAHLAAMSLASPLWGRLADRFGNRPVLRLCTMVVTLAPLPWMLITPSLASWAWLIAFVTGVFWSGIELGNFNLMLSLFPKERRAVSMALFAMIAGFTAGVAPMLSGALADLLKTLPPVQIVGWTPGAYRIIFMLSFLGRVLTTVIFLPRMQEPRAASTRHLLKSVASDLEERFASRRIR
ncbi:MAG: MFS transporter [Armatimonadetes bacterium]|nr:MFS transporter [Armatimonadota bacterium]